MKKWIDDLYAILLKRGYNTLDDVLKKSKIIMDNEYVYEGVLVFEIDETKTINLNQFSTNTFFSIAYVTELGYRFYFSFYKSLSNACFTMFNNNVGFTIISVTDNILSIKNTSNAKLSGKLLFKNSF